MTSVGAADSDSLELWNVIMVPVATNAESGSRIVVSIYTLLATSLFPQLSESLVKRSPPVVSPAMETAHLIRVTAVVYWG